MPARAHCGVCGEAFALAEVLEPPRAGHCPRCDTDLAPGYDAVAVPALRRLLDALDTVRREIATLRGVAPRLRVDTGSLTADLAAVSDG
jgi:hypothetical protein